MTQTPGTTSTVQLPADCVVCHRGGKLGGTTTPRTAGFQWIHRTCHRLHRSGRHQVVVPAQRRSRSAR